MNHEDPQDPPQGGSRAETKVSAATYSPSLVPLRRGLLLLLRRAVRECDPDTESDELAQLRAAMQAFKTQKGQP